MKTARGKGKNKDTIILYHDVQVGIVVACLSVAAVRAQQDESNNPFAKIPRQSPPAASCISRLPILSRRRGAGDRGPALATGSFRHGDGDDDLFHNIRTGIPGTQMPAFSALATDDIWRIISYLRSIANNGAAVNEVVPGDLAAGEKTFWGKGGCSRCHEVNGKGGIVAPDLSAVGTTSAERLHLIIVDPNAALMAATRWFGPSDVQIKTRDGKEVRGAKLAEDNDTLILTDENGKLHRFDKQDVVEQHAELLMPANYSQVLSPSEIQDLVAYLKSLKARDLSKTIQADPPGGLSFERIKNAQAETQNWLTYWGNYQGQHFSPSSR